jgi:hypothetical protein
MDISLPATTVKIDSLDCPSYPDEAVVRAAQEAWGRLRSNATWDDWRQVGRAHLIGRHKAMTEAGVNRPIGRRYNEAFGAWQREFGFENLDQGDRARLFEVMSHLAEIEAWLATLTTGERVRLNHPTSILRKWKGSIVVADPNAAPKPPSAYAKMKEVNVDLQERLHRAEREIAAHGGDLWGPEDNPAIIAKIMLVQLSPSKAERVARQILKVLEDQKGDCT